ncbi:MAG: PAS domain S-box protein [Deltaproteobacteria bacterium]|jgi:PAS domain S-box-containing protein|nr:PAS domain S-box protein [Deltaproteobacteria bacterium]
MTAIQADGPRPLMQQNRYLAHIFESIPTGVVALDAEGKIVSFNRTAERITGRAADEVLGRMFDGVFQADYFQHPALRLNNILSTRETTEIRTKVVPDNRKKKLHLNVAISPLNSVKDGHIGTVLSLTDITRMQNLEMQAKRTGRLAAMGEMAARIAHEIRNPLGSIELFSTMLIDDLQEFEEQKTLAQHISAGVKSINNIVSNLLLFIRPDQQLDEQVFDVHEALKDSLFFAGHLLDGQDEIDVQTRLTAETLFIKGDLELLKQVFLNLILNAIQAMAGGGQLHISSYKTGSNPDTGLAEVHLVDNGCGIARADMSRIFDPFYTTRKRGTGLGLTIVHNILKLHGGGIDITSSAEGTKCIVTLPLWSDSKQNNNENSSD